MIHDYDQAAWLAGDATTISATHWYDDEGEHARVTLTHTGGATSEVEGGWGPPGTPFRTQLHVTGDLGTMDHDSLGDPSPSESPYTAQLRDLVSACTDGRRHASPSPTASGLYGSPRRYGNRCASDTPSP